jgi:hypothetical protein
MEVNDGLKVIREYDQKQKFMSMLGQEEFWKKNRLILWKQLDEMDITDHILSLNIPDKNIIHTDFINTDYMLNQIKYRLEAHYDEVYTKKEERVLSASDQTNLTHRDDYNYNHTHGRHKSLRTRLVSTKNLSVRHSDMQDFNRELDALYKKYAVLNVDRLKNGKRYFDTRSVSTRFVKLYYKL